MPTVAFTGDPSPGNSQRYGDTFDVRGAGTNTQVLIGLLPALAHPHPRRAFVVGFGSGVSVRTLMTAEPITVDANLPLDRFAQEFILGRHHPAFPVMEGERVVGMLTRGVPLAHRIARAIAEYFTARA